MPPKEAAKKPTNNEYITRSSRGREIKPNKNVTFGDDKEFVKRNAKRNATIRKTLEKYSPSSNIPDIQKPPSLPFSTPKVPLDVSTTTQFDDSVSNLPNERLKDIKLYLAIYPNLDKNKEYSFNDIRVYFDKATLGELNYKLATSDVDSFIDGLIKSADVESEESNYKINHDEKQKLNKEIFLHHLKEYIFTPERWIENKPHQLNPIKNDVKGGKNSRKGNKKYKKKRHNTRKQRK